MYKVKNTIMATRKSGLRSLEVSMDPRACGCRGVMSRSRTVSIHDSLVLQRSRWGGM